MSVSERMNSSPSRRLKRAHSKIAGIRYKLIKACLQIQALEKLVNLQREKLKALRLELREEKKKRKEEKKRNKSNT